MQGEWNANIELPASSSSSSLWPVKKENVEDASEVKVAVADFEFSWRNALFFGGDTASSENDDSEGERLWLELCLGWSCGGWLKRALERRLYDEEVDDEALGGLGGVGRGFVKAIVQETVSPA